MPFCPGCRKELAQDSRVCGQCGAPLEKTVPGGSYEPAYKRKWFKIALVFLAVMIVLCVIANISLNKKKSTAVAAITESSVMPAAVEQTDTANNVAVVPAPDSRPEGGLTAVLLPSWQKISGFAADANRDIDLQNGAVFENTDIIDSNENQTVINVFLPPGWLTELSCSWREPSMFYPGIINLYVVSPADDAAMIFVSPQQFRQASTPKATAPDGMADRDLFVQYLSYRTADELADFFFNRYFPMAHDRVALNTVPGDPASLDNMLAAANDLIGAIQKSWDDARLPKELSLSVGMPEAGLAARDYRFSARGSDKTWYARVITATIGFHEDLEGLFIENRLDWFCPYVFILAADSEDAFNRSLNLFDIFTGTLRLSREFIVHNSRLGAQIATDTNRSLRFNLAARTVYGATGGFAAQSRYNDIMTFLWSNAFGNYNKLELDDGKTVNIPKNYGNIYTNETGSLFVSGGKTDPGEGWAKAD